MTTIIEFKNGVFSVLDFFFSTQSPKTINDIEHQFPKAMIYLDIRELEVYTPAEGEPPIPVITILPSTSSERWQSKCDEVNGGIGYSEQLRIPATCYVKVLAYSPLSLPDGTPANHKLLADYTWDLFQLVVNTQVSLFNAVNIFKPKCDRYPEDVTDDKETVLIGNAYFETTYTSRPE